MSAMELEESQENTRKERPQGNVAYGHSGRAPQPATWGVFLSLLGLGFLIAISVSTLLASQAWRISACHSLASQLATRLSPPLQSFEANLAPQAEILRELEAGISSLFLLEPMTNTLRSLFGDTRIEGSSASLSASPSANFVQTLLLEIMGQRNLITENGPEGFKKLMRAALIEPQLALELPVGLSGRESLGEALSEVQLRVSASANLLEATTRAWNEQLEKTKALRQRILLVRADAALFFGIESSEDLSELSDAQIDSTFSLRSHFYSSGILQNIPIFSSVPDGLTSPEELRNAIISAGGAAHVADGTNAQDRQAKFASLQQTGSALLREAGEMESSSASLLATLEEQVRDLKTHQISKLQLLTGILVRSFRDLFVALPIKASLIEALFPLAEPGKSSS